MEEMTEKEYRQVYRQNNKEKIAEKRKVYRQNNKENNKKKSCIIL